MQKIPTNKHQLTKDLNVKVSFGQNDLELIKERKKWKAVRKPAHKRTKFEQEREVFSERREQRPRQTKLFLIVTITYISGMLYSLPRAFSYVFFPNTCFDSPSVGGILGRNSYPHFTDEEIEVQSALVIIQKCIVEKKKRDGTPSQLFWIPSPEPFLLCFCLERAEERCLLPWLRTPGGNLIG